MSSKFAPDIPKSLIDAVSSIMNEAKADELPPIDKTEAQKRKERQAKLDAIEDKRAERDAGKEKPKSAVTKVSGTQYGGSKQKDDPEQQDEELKGNQSKIDANHNGKIDADDFKKLRAMKKEELSPKQKKIAAMAGDKGKIDAADLAALRSGKKPGCDTYDEEVEQQDEAAYSAKAARAGKDIGKPGKNFAMIASKAGKRYGSTETGKKVAGAILAKIRAKHEEVEQVAEILTKKTPAKTWIHDFVHSKNPKFAGKSTKERQKMALGAYYGKKDESVNEGIVNHADIAKDLVKKHGKDVTMDHIDDYIDGADDAHKVDKREVLHHIKLLQDMKWESVQITEGMKEVYDSMMDLADKKGYKNHKQFTKSDYETIGKEHGVSGGDVAIVAGHHTADSYNKLKEATEPKKIEPPFTPDKKPKKIAIAGKHGYGPSAAKHLADLGMKGLQKNSFDPLEEGTGGPIYTKPLVKLGDLLARAKDMRNIKKATIVTPKDETQVVMKKEETEQIDETVWDGGDWERQREKIHRKPDVVGGLDGERPNRKPDLVWPGGREKPNKEFRPEKKPIDPEGGPQKPRKVQAEETEQIDEIGNTPAGKKALGSYLNKAVTQSVGNAHGSGLDRGTYHGERPKDVLSYTGGNNQDNKDFASNAKRHGGRELKNRLKGIERATSRLSKEETEQVDETMMGKAGCTSEDDKKKDKKPVDYDKPTFLRKVNDWRKSNPKFQPKKLPMSKAAGALAAEEFVSEAHFMEIPSDVKKEIKKHIDNDDHDAARSTAVKAGYWAHFNHLVSAAAHSSHMDHDTHHTDIKQLHPYMSDYLTDKKTNESEQITMMSPEYLERYKQKLAKNNKRFVAAVKRQKNPGSNTDIAKDIEKRYHQTGKWEEVERINEVGDTEAGRKKLGNYVKKASTDRSTDAFDHGESEYRQYGEPGENPELDKDMKDRERRMANREKGIGRAVNRLLKQRKEEVSLDESVKVKKEYDDKDETEHGVYHNGKKIGYVVHHKPSNTHTAYHSPSSYDEKGHADDYEDIDDFHNHEDAVNQIKHSAGVSVHESLDETAVLDKYIRSMGYDPQHLDKNKKVMFSKTNAYKTYAMSQEGLYDGGQKGTQDIDTHMSPGATARG